MLSFGSLTCHTIFDYRPFQYTMIQVWEFIAKAFTLNIKNRYKFVKQVYTSRFSFVHVHTMYIWIYISDDVYTKVFEWLIETKCGHILSHTNRICAVHYKYWKIKSSNFHFGLNSSTLIIFAVSSMSLHKAQAHHVLGVFMYSTSRVIVQNMYVSHKIHHSLRTYIIYIYMWHVSSILIHYWLTQSWNMSGILRNDCFHLEL